MVTDINSAVVARARRELGAVECAGDAIYETDCDIFSPCARGAILNARTIARLRCRAVVGCANNQLEVPEDGLRLWGRKIFYAPDFVVNAGGIMNIFTEYEGYDRAKAIRRAEGIYETMTKIIVRSQSENTPTYLIANKIAQERLNA